MKAAKRKRAAAASVRADDTAIDAVAQQAAPSVAAEQAMPSIEDAAAEVLLATQMPAEVAEPEVTAEPAMVAPEIAMPEVAAPEVNAAMPAAQPLVRLDSNCTVKDAAALKQSLCAVLNSEAAVVIDVAGVERIDTAAIQVLCAFARQRAAAARAVTWQGIPTALREAARLLGVSELLMLPAEAGAAP